MTNAEAKAPIEKENNGHRLSECSRNLLDRRNTCSNYQFPIF